MGPISYDRGLAVISLVGLLVCLVALFVGYYCYVAVVVLLLRSQVCINFELLSVLPGVFPGFWSGSV